MKAETLIQTYLRQEAWRVRENSNIAFSLQGLHAYITTHATEQFWLNVVYPRSIANAHRRGDLHIHDAGILGAYCVGWDLYDFLLRGIAPVAGKVASAPPRHFRTALGQLVNLLYTLQGEAAGAQAVANVDTLLAPFIRADGLTYPEVKQALQEFVFNLNIPTRVGFQSPFTNITLDVVPSPVYRDWPVIIGGQPQATTYGDYQQEMDWFNQAFCEIMLAGDAQGRGFTFPIPTYNVTADFPWDGPVGAAIARMTAKYGTPYFANFINSEMRPEDARSMCCRLRLDLRELERRGGGLFGANPLTGSLGVVTINLPRIGYERKTVRGFLQRLGQRMDLAKESLRIKRQYVEELTEIGLYPYAAAYLAGVKESQGAYWANHFNTIGLVGMHEAALNLIGRGIETPEGQAFAIEVLRWMRERLLAYQQETGVLFNLEATPAESTAYRLARLDRARYPNIIQSGDSDGETYYTNSTHLPVGFTDDPFEMLEHQDSLQSLYTGGTVAHIFLGERISDPTVLPELIDTICRSFRLPYFTFTPTYSICKHHGYLAGDQPICPLCGVQTEVWSRVVGYYRPVQQWNVGKQQEFRDRQPYQLPKADRLPL